MELAKKIGTINLIVHVMRAMVARDVKHKLVCNKRARTFSSFSFLLAFVCFYSVRNDATITHNRLPLAREWSSVYRRRRRKRGRVQQKKERRQEN
jgi:hypothetical protein